MDVLIFSLSAYFRNFNCKVSNFVQSLKPNTSAPYSAQGETVKVKIIFVILNIQRCQLRPIYEVTHRVGSFGLAPPCFENQKRVFTI